MRDQVIADVEQQTIGGDEVIAVDIGGTTLKGARYDRQGRPVAVRDVPTPRGSGAILAAIRGLVAYLADSSAHRAGARVVAAGIGVPGLVDPRTGVVKYATNLGWHQVPLRDTVEELLGVPVAVDHDVAAAALAESREIGQDLVFVSIGTGIACAHVIRGSVWRGATGAAGEIGHICVDPVGERCECGQRGCLELYASAAGIGRRYAARGLPAHSVAAIAATLDSDPVAAEVWNLAADMIGLALATDVLVFDPPLIVLGGGLAMAGELLAEPVRKSLADHLAWRAAPEVRTSALGTEAGRRGAAELAWQLAADRALTEEGTA
jgi:glucokinase